MSFQLLGGTEARRRGEEVRHVVSERTVIGVLGHCHELYRIVSRLLYARQYELREFIVRSDALSLLRHAHVRFVYEQIADRSRVERLASPFVRTRRPELGGEILRPLVLHHAGGVCGYAVVPAVGAVYVEFVERAVREQMAVHGVGEKCAPHAALALVETYLCALPRVEVAENVCVYGFGQPFAEPPAAQLLVALPSEVAVSVGIVDYRTRLRGYGLHAGQISRMAFLYAVGHGPQPFVALYHGEFSSGGVHNF